jgi:hypothetical protein
VLKLEPVGTSTPFHLSAPPASLYSPYLFSPFSMLAYPTLLHAPLPFLLTPSFPPHTPTLPLLPLPPTPHPHQAMRWMVQCSS